MGILQDMLEKPKELLNEKKVDATYSKPGSSGTADDILLDDNEVERLSHYIAEDEKAQVINIQTGVKHGVEKIGTSGDTNHVLKKLLMGASKAAKKYAASIYAKKWGRKNLLDKFVTKSGKEVTGKMLSKNIYLKEVVVKYTKGARAGKTISYIQGRNKLTGRVVSYKTVAKLIGKLKTKSI